MRSSRVFDSTTDWAGLPRSTTLAVKTALTILYDDPVGAREA